MNDTGLPSPFMLIMMLSPALRTSHRAFCAASSAISTTLPGSVVRVSDDAPQKSLWEVRKAGLNIMMSLKGDGKPVSFIEDCAVPLEHLAEYTDRLTEVFARHGTHGTWYAHASVGTLHVRPILDMRRDGPEGGAARMRAIAEEASELVRNYNCLLYTSPSPRDGLLSRMPSSA